MANISQCTLVLTVPFEQCILQHDVHCLLHIVHGTRSSAHWVTAHFRRCTRHTLPFAHVTHCTTCPWTAPCALGTPHSTLFLISQWATSTVSLCAETGRYGPNIDSSQISRQQQEQQQQTTNAPNSFCKCCTANLPAQAVTLCTWSLSHALSPKSEVGAHNCTTVAQGGGVTLGACISGSARFWALQRIVQSTVQSFASGKGKGGFLVFLCIVILDSSAIWV